MLDPRFAPGSPMRLVVEQLAHKWALLVVAALQPGPKRYSELRAVLADVAPQVLTRSLRDLERNGLIARQVFAEVPPRVVYSLTDLGATLCRPLEALIAWAEAHHPRMLAAQQAYDAAVAARGR